MKNKALIIHANSKHEGLSIDVAGAIQAVLEAKGFKIEVLDLFGLGYDPVMPQQERGVYSSDNDLKPFFHFNEVEHIWFVYPTWWGSAPALLKGFIEREWRHGVAFRENEDGTLNPLLHRIQTFGVVTTYAQSKFMNEFPFSSGKQLFKRIKSVAAPNAKFIWISQGKIKERDSAGRLLRRVIDKVQKC